LDVGVTKAAVTRRALDRIPELVFAWWCRHRSGTGDAAPSFKAVHL
jgi:hypothetical protein